MKKFAVIGLDKFGFHSAQIPTKIGANRVIYSEHEAASRLVKKLAEHIDDETMHDYKVKLIAHKNHGIWHTDSEIVINDAPVTLGNIAEIEKLSRML